MRKTRGFELHCAPSWWGKMVFWFEAMGGNVSKEMIYPNRIRGDPGKNHPPPHPPSITGTPADHLSQWVSFIVEHAATALKDTKKVAHATHSLKLCCPQKYLSLELVQQLY